MDIDEKHRDLAWLLTSTGWNGVFKPVAVERIKGLYQRLIDPTSARKDRLPDDFIRGQINALMWVLEWPEKEMGQVAQLLKDREAEQVLNQQSGPTPH